MRAVRYRLSKVFCILLIFLANCATAAEVCRARSFEGMRSRVEAVKELVGSDTSSLEGIKLYMGLVDGYPYIQSNFRSEIEGEQGHFHQFPTKLKGAVFTDIRVTLSNVIFDGPPPPDSNQVVDQVLQSVVVYVDSEMVKSNGQPALDLTGARRIHLVSNNKELETGKIETMRLKNPPPALVEKLKGVRYSGRPPGRARQIREQLEGRPFSSSDFSFLPLVADTGTRTVVEEQPVLKAAAIRTVKSNSDWNDQLSEALERSQGRNLIVLAHIEGKDVAVRMGGDLVFSISIAELRGKAKAANVDLILLGCDTAGFIDAASEGLGVSGSVNSVEIVRRLEEAVKGSSNVSHIADKLASEDIMMVAYDELGGYGYAGASAFAKVEGTGFFARVFRLLALKNWK